VGQRRVAAMIALFTRDRAALAHSKSCRALTLGLVLQGVGRGAMTADASMVFMDPKENGSAQNVGGGFAASLRMLRCVCLAPIVAALSLARSRCDGEKATAKKLKAIIMGWR